MTTTSDPRASLLQQRLAGLGSAPVQRAVTRANDEQRGVLSFAQERLWFMEQLVPGTAAYHVSTAVPLDGPMDAAALQAALHDLTCRHVALRCAFPADESGMPCLLVHDDIDVPLSLVTDAQEPSAGDEPFDLENGPLVRARLHSPDGLDGAVHTLVLEAHHLVTDGWSTDLLVKDLLRSLEAGDAPSPAGEIDYLDYAVWQRQRASRDDVAFWRDQLVDIPALHLPTDRRRPAQQTFDGLTHHRMMVDAQRQAQELATRFDCSTFMVLMTIYQLVLARLSDQDRFSIGTPVAGRTHSELESVVGMFVNMLPLAVDLTDDPSFEAALLANKRQFLSLLDHQELPFEQLVNELDVPRDPSRSPIFQATLALQNFERDAASSSAGGGWRPLELRSTRFDLEWRAAETPGGLWCEVTFNRDLFDTETVARVMDMVEHALAAAVTDPSVPVSRIPLAATDLHHPAATGPHAPARAETVLAMLNDLAARGEDTAVQYDGARVSYAELDAWSGQVAAELASRGCGRGDVVAVEAVRSLSLVPTIVGVLRAGCAFLPIDPDLPTGRQDLMARIAGARAKLTVDEQAQLRDQNRPTDRSPRLRSADAAYVIFTSGSTGEPKGVVNTHGGLVNRLAWMQDAYGLTEHDVVLQKTPASFDVSVWELLWALTAGASVTLAVADGHRDPEYLAQTCADTGVTVLHFVPSMLSAFVASGAELPPTVRQVVCSGEALSGELVRRFLDRHPGLALDNLYGPTEAAIDVSRHICVPPIPDDLPIGVPVSNTTLYVLDSALQQVPTGVVGTLFIGGAQVARGYAQRPGLTAARFIPDPFDASGTTMYDTGDRARWNPDGTLTYLGRVDDQVKVRGQRIELGEVSAALRSTEGVRDVAVMVREDRPGDRRLAAYVVGDVDTSRVHVQAANLLPEFMMPSTITVLDELPTTRNGKLDRGALPEPSAQASGAVEEVPLSTATEHLMAALWGEVLGQEVSASSADFFDVGGHSLLAAQLVARIRREREGDKSNPVAHSWRPVSVMDVFTHRRLSDLAAYADGTASDGPGGLLHELTPRGRPARSRLVCIPYGGGSAAVYQPLADALPDDVALHAVAIPGHDVGTDEDPLPFDDAVTTIADEVMELESGRLRLYGHCGVGTAMITAVALEVERRGREVDAVYEGAMFPIARPKRGRALLERLNRMEGNRSHQNWLKSMGVDMGDLEVEHADRIIANMRRDTSAAETWFTDRYDEDGPRLNAPIVSVVGDQDPVTDFYEERFREWTRFGHEARLTVLPGAGHFFLKHRADELAQIVTSSPTDFRGAVDEQSTTTPPSMTRFAAVAVPQTITLIGSAMTSWALPIYLFLEQNSVGALATLAITGLVPMILVTPLAGSVSDRFNRRHVMLGAGSVSLTIQVVLLALVVSGMLRPWMLYVLVVILASASAFQRVAYMSAVPQVVPKRYLAHAMGFVQLSASVSTLIVPVIAAGLMAAIGLRAIVTVNVITWMITLTLLAFVRFPDLAGRTRREGWLESVTAGFRYVREHPGMRRMIGLSAVVNIFIAPALLLIVPLVLSLGDETDMGRVSLLEGAGAVAGGVLMSAWGGPPVRRMRAALAVTALLGVFIALVGLRPSLVLIAIGVCGFAGCIELLQATYATIIQTKVPQRLHGRLLSLNIMLSWSTLPIGYLIGVWAAGLLEPALTGDGGLVDSPIGSLVGAGPGRGIGLVFVLAGVIVLAISMLVMTRPTYWDFDTVYADDVPDDLLGLRDSGAPQEHAEHRRVLQEG